jgi:cathepsin H
MASVGTKGGSLSLIPSEDELLNAVGTVGPVSIAYQVINGFKDYTSGVYHSNLCLKGPMDVNHAVLAIGYGNQDGMDYWLVKNSWGTGWGDQGYFKI